MSFKIAKLLPFMLMLSGPVFADDSNKETYNWTGVYVGGFVGGASSANISSSEPISNQFGYWNKPYANSNNYDTNASFIGGGTVGYNWQIPKAPLLIGLEGEYGYLDMSGSNSDPNTTPWNVTNQPSPLPEAGGHSTNIGGSYGYGLVGGRVGYTMDRVLLYVKSAAVFTNTQTNYDEPFPIDRLSTSGKSNTVGYGIGGGIEYALPFQWSNNISIKTEYLYLGINRTQTTSGTDSYAGYTWTTTDKISGISTAKLGVNYKF